MSQVLDAVRLSEVPVGTCLGGNQFVSHTALVGSAAASLAGSLSFGGTVEVHPGNAEPGPGQHEDVPSSQAPMDVPGSL